MKKTRICKKSKLVVSTLSLSLLLASSAAYAADDLTSLKSEINDLRIQVKEAGAWKNPDTMIHMAGYADVNFVNTDPGGSSFVVGSFSPIFHYQYRDLMMLEAELEIETTANGGTTVAMEYAAIDLFLNDHVTFVGGKFLSPLGQFRQNMHPSWINKLPSAPSGFGHDQAAPNADVGAQLRGGFSMGPGTANYAVYMANGPALELNGTDIEKIETPGIGADGDGNKVVGGRFGIFAPKAKLDVGVSAASGKASVWDGATSPTYNSGQHSYQVLGADFAYRPVSSLELRGETIQQQVGDTAGETGGTWQAWYVQAAYRMLPSKWEFVGRFGQYETPGTDDDRRQMMAGVNYVFANNAVAKLGYENNENPNAGLTAANRLLLQLAYGF